MSSEARCSFCRQLPATAKKRGGKPGKCPVCKGELLVTADVSFRLVSAEEMALEANGRKPRSRKPAAFLALVGCLVLAGWLGKQFLIGSPDAAKETPSVAMPGIAARVSSPVEAPELVASAQPRPISAAMRFESVAARKPAPGVAKMIPVNADLPRAKEKTTTAEVSVRKILSPASYFDLSVKKSGLFSFQYGEIARVQLFEAPEIDLDEPLAPSTSFGADQTKKKENDARAKITQKIQDILKQTQKDRDAFVKTNKKRADLSGLPFMMGEQCRLSAKAAKGLQSSSRTIRGRLDLSKKSGGSYSTSEGVKDNGSRFWDMMHVGGETLPALEQILLAESVSHRKLFMNNLKEMKGKDATRILVQRAIFDLDSEVREAALEALKNRPPNDVDPYLLQGLRYPWQQAVFHSAEALVKLNRIDLAPAVADMLDMPGPDAPFLGGPKKDQLMVRELVRVNHHRNCLLCHAPVGSNDRRELIELRHVPLGPIPTPGKEMPSSAVVYYSFRSDDNIVRADVTYLRQDFSILLPVAYAHPWPAEQRYDFLVRVRTLKTEEVRQVKNRIQPVVTDHKAILVLTLKALTGEDAGNSAAAWRRVLDPRLERVWRSACNK